MKRFDDAMMKDTESVEDSDADAETRSAPGDLGGVPQRTRATKWSHSRQASQGVPFRNVEKPRRIRDIRDKHWQEKQNEMIEFEMSVLVQESQCGIGKWRPSRLSFLGSRRWMIILLCWYCAVQGIVVNGLVPSAISSIERRFKLSTSTMGRIVQFYDFGYVLFCIPVSYFGGRHSKPAVLGAGLALMAFGSLLFSTPHMLADSYSTNQDSKSFGSCSIRTPWNISDADALALTASCEAEKQNQPGTFRFVFLFCMAHFLHGIGATPLFTIGVSYIDENVGKALSSLFVGIFYSFAVFGPAAGFLTAGTFLTYHTDFWHLPAEQISRVSGDETDPSWVGAWWLGFVLASLVAMVAVIPIACLPKVLPESLKWHRNRLVETSQASRRRTPECCGLAGTNKTAALYRDAPSQEDSTLLLTSITTRGRGPLWYKLWLDVRHIPIAIYRILTNAPFMLITLALAIDSLVVTGASSFMSKYLERQFNVPPSNSSFLIGCIMVPMAGIGCMISGFIVQYFRLNCVTTLKLSVGLLFFSLILTPMYLIYCPHDPLVGVETTYPDRDGQISVGNYSDVEPSLRSSCNSHCLCSESEFRPVCAEFVDGRQLSYYSPCFAGCSEPYSPMQKIYSNCTCVVETPRLHVRQVKKGLCESKCKGLLGFLIIFAPLSLCTFGVGVPIISVILRTVDYNERSFALGIQGILVRIIGTIPAPVLFGWMFDVSCIRYQSEPCGDSESGSCLLYSNKLLADLFLTFSIIGQALAMVILTSVLMVYGGTLQDDPLPDVALKEVDHVVEDGEDRDKAETAAPLLQ
ncbi:hypothetical protein RB195_021581 [Necator americanus]|uniref:Solute carrier organic anion transporter family member n=2 Tax=Necator americanus TaxID=51031 RepID=A0ABR1EEB6_NECAM